MKITHQIKVDLVKKLIPPRIYAMQYDTNTRVVEIILTANAEPWVPSEGISFDLSYKKPDGTQGFYNQLDEDVFAITVAGNKVSVTLAHQVLTAPGIVEAALVMTDPEMDRLSSFPFQIYVAADPSAGKTQSDDFYKSTPMNAVLVVPQNLSLEKQAQARANIGVCFSPDDFEGTDSEKLQACFDALANVGGVITINRPLTLTDNVQIRNNSGLSLQIVVQAGGKQAKIDMGEYHFYGVEKWTGGVSFNNIEFQGANYPFDCTNLIRLRLDGCFFSNFEHIIYSDAYVQSVNFTNSYFRSLSGYIYHAMAEGTGIEGNMLDCHFSHNVVEGSNGVMSCMTANGCSFTDNCIEGCTKPDDLFYTYYHMIGVEISNNYFEVNTGAVIDFSKSNQYAYFRVTICNNHFMELDEGKVMIVMPNHPLGTASNIIIYGNEMPVGSNAVLIKSEVTERLKSVVCFANHGTIVDENNSLDYLTAQEIATMIKRHKGLYPSDPGRRFATTAVVHNENQKIAYAVVSTPYNLDDCTINTIQLYGNVGGVTPTKVSLSSKEGHCFVILITLPSDLPAGSSYTMWGSYQISGL